MMNATFGIRDLIPRVINVADYPVNSNVDEISIKDSKETTAAVVVKSKMRRLAAEKTRAAFVSVTVFDTHNVHDDDVREYIPILDRKGKITGLGYTRKNGKMFSQNGQGVHQRYVWENFMDRHNSDKEHYPILNERGT
jgi:hypothetical protein